MKNKIIFAVLFFLALIGVMAFSQLSAQPKEKPQMINYTTAFTEYSIAEVKSETGANTETTVNFPIDINKATKDELMCLDGIGEVLAERIIVYRDEHGDFYSVDELVNVKGIGESIFQKNADKITVNIVKITSATHTEKTEIAYAQTHTFTSEITTAFIETARETTETKATTAKQTEMQVTFPIDINTATKDELMCLDGIGDVLAGRIITYREEHGGFYSVDELANVKGIGEAILRRNAEKIYADASYLPPREEPLAEETAEISAIEIQRVNLNTATYEELAQLPITPQMARNILELRGKIIYFTATEELLLADGMTNSIYNSISMYVYV